MADDEYVVVLETELLRFHNAINELAEEYRVVGYSIAAPPRGDAPPAWFSAIMELRPEPIEIESP